MGPFFGFSLEDDEGCNMNLGMAMKWRWSKMETNYRVAYNKYWQDLKKKVPEEIASQLAVTYLSNTRQFVVTFFSSEYILD